MAGGVHDDGGGCAWRGACVAMVGGVCGKGGMCAMHALHPPPILQDTVNERAVCILLEGILVFHV